MTEHSFPPVSQAVGYGIVVGVGLAFAVGMILVTTALRRYQRERVDASEFATAGRSVSSGLIASAVVSSWTWAATLMESTTQAYSNGVFGPIAYAAAASVQIVLFATLAIELKRKAPGVYTYLEIMKSRFGTLAHAIYIFFALATNILVMAMLIAGSSATVQALTGMHPVATCFLVPLGVTLYTLAGGLKATFLTDYVHTLILYVILFIFAFSVYATNSYLGSPGRLYDLLTELAKSHPIEGNKDGSYLTMKSRPAGIFMVINLTSAFGTVFLDTGYWSKAIAASPAAALPGYFIGGLAWFALPWVCATSMGLAGAVLEHTPLWPTYPNPMTPEQVSAGLTLPYTAVALLGKGGGAAALLIVFMAVTSAASAEMVAVSSIWTYDLYRSYINPRATSKQLMFQTHSSVVVFVMLMIGFSIGLHYGGVGMGYLFTLMGILICSAVLPVSLTMFWSGLNRWSVWISPPLGLSFGIAAWVATTAGLYDNVFTLDTTGSDYPMMAGNIVSLCSPIIIIAVCQLVGGNVHYDFNELKPFQVMHTVLAAEENNEYDTNKGEVGVDTRAVLPSEQFEDDASILSRSAHHARIACLVVTLSLLILWPMPMYGSGYVFSKPFFTGWVIVGLIWLFLSMFSVELLPLWQGRKAIRHTCRGIWWDVTGQSQKLRMWQKGHPDELHKAISPVLSPILGTVVDHDALTQKQENTS